MKMNRKFRRWSRKRIWAGLLVLLAVACGEFWMVLSFSRDCAQSVAQEELSAGFSVPEYFLVSR